MSITRAPRPTGNFYLLDKAISEDKRLSWAARGLLVFLLGKPDHWQVSVTNLVNETKDAIGKSTGRDAVYGLLHELLTAGYLRRVGQTRGDGGKMAGAEYVVHETADLQPCPEKPYTADPYTAEPLTAEPYTAKPTQASTDQKQVLRDKQVLKRAGAPVVRPEGVSEGVWSDFLTLRQKKRAPLTATALEEIELEAGKAGMTVDAALRMCCKRGWQGFEAAWVCDQLPARGARPVGGVVDIEARNGGSKRLLGFGGREDD